MTNLVLDNFSAETETSREHVKVDGAKASVNRRRVSRRNVENLLSHSTENLIRGNFGVSGASHLSGANILVNPRGGYRKMSKNFRLQKFRDAHFWCFWKFLVWKLCETGVSQFPVQILLSRCRKKRSGTLLYPRKTPLWKNFQDKRGAGLTIFRPFFSHSIKKIRREPLFQKFSVINFFCKRRGGGYPEFPSIFCLTVPNFFVVEAFYVSENFCYRKFSCIRERKGVSRLPSKFSYLTVILMSTEVTKCPTKKHQKNRVLL